MEQHLIPNSDYNEEDQLLVEKICCHRTTEKSPGGRKLILVAVEVLALTAISKASTKALGFARSGPTAGIFQKIPIHDGTETPQASGKATPLLCDQRALTIEHGSMRMVILIVKK